MSFRGSQKIKKNINIVKKFSFTFGIVISLVVLSVIASAITPYQRVNDLDRV
jgi:hypothetical protein